MFSANVFTRVRIHTVRSSRSQCTIDLSLRLKTLLSYLTKDGDVYMDRVERIMLGLGEVEDEIFKRRQVSLLIFIRHKFVP